MRFLSASDPYHGLTADEVSSLTTSILTVRESRWMGERSPSLQAAKILTSGETGQEWGTHLFIHFSQFTLPADRTSKDIQ